MDPKAAAKYRYRAEELRTIAESMHDASARDSVLSVARQYDAMAANIDVKTDPKPAVI